MTPFRPNLLNSLLHHHIQLRPHFPLHTPTTTRLLSTTPIPKYAGGQRPLPPRPTIDESTITESFLKGTGPGGQKINKTSSAVQLKHLPTGIVIKCQETRSRSQNRKIARRILAERIEERELGAGSRTALKVERERGKKASKLKKSRRKYRKLAEGEEGGTEEEIELEVGEEEEVARQLGETRDEDSIGPSESVLDGEPIAKKDQERG